MKFIASKKTEDTYEMYLKSAKGQVNLGHHDEDELIVQAQDDGNLQVSYFWNIQKDKPVKNGRYRVLLRDRERMFKDSPYFYPSWHVARWDGESFTLFYLYRVEVGYGEEIHHEDVSQRVIRWEKLPDWMPVEVV